MESEHESKAKYSDLYQNTDLEDLVLNENIQYTNRIIQNTHNYN